MSDSESTKWSFPNSPFTAVFTSRSIVDKTDWIHYVSHDHEDGSWQFHPFSGVTPEAEAVVVSLASVVDIDNSLTELSDLQPGWCAWRESRNVAWKRARITDVQ